MRQLDAKKRATLPNSAFAYVDSGPKAPADQRRVARSKRAGALHPAFEDEAARDLGARL
jgi:hypothetical protein